MSNNPSAQTQASTARDHAGALGKSLASDALTRKNIGLVAVVAVVGILGLSGGFEAAEPAGFVSVPAATLSSGQPAPAVEASPLTVEVGRSYIIDGARVVEVQLTSSAERPIDPLSLNLAFGLHDSTQPADEQPQLLAQSYRLPYPAVAQPLSELPTPEGVPLTRSVSPNPGVPVDLAIVFPDHDANGAPERADTLTISSLEYRTSFLDGSQRWFPKDLIAEVALP